MAVTLTLADDIDLGRGDMGSPERRGQATPASQQPQRITPKQMACGYSLLCDSFEKAPLFFLIAVPLTGK